MEKLDSAQLILDKMYRSFIKDEGRLLSMINTYGLSQDAHIHEMGTAVRYMAIALLEERLGKLSEQMWALVDNLEQKSLRHFKSLADQYLNKSGPEISTLIHSRRI